jgi:hypothetical protein
MQSNKGSIIIGSIIVTVFGAIGAVVSAIAKSGSKKASRIEPEIESQEAEDEFDDTSKWRDLLMKEMELKGTGKFEEELDAFIYSFIPVDETTEFQELFDRLAVQIGSPYGQLTHGASAVWAGFTVLLHLRLRVCYDDNKEELKKELNSTALMLPMLAAKAAGDSGNRYETSNFIVRDIIEKILKEKRYEEVEDETYDYDDSDFFAESATP